jgi:hypothetical protein
MNITNLVYDVLVEEVKNKKQFAFLLKKWYGDEPTPQQIKRAEENLQLFFEKQKGLTLNNPGVLSFLHRWDGVHGLGVKVPDLDNNGVQKQNNGQPMFKLVPFNFDDVKDPGRYTLEQFEDLLDEFRDATLNGNDGEDEFKGKLDATPEKIKASNKLWLSERNSVVNEEGFKVHYISDAREAIKYGYYQQVTTKKLGGAQWCVTGRNTTDSRGNLWGTYRPVRTFWFVIDESKNPIDNPDPKVHKYYLCALQYCERDKDYRSNPYTGFKMTSMLNDGDEPKTWEEVTQIYPQLAEHRDLFKYIKYDESELFDRDIVNRLNETPGNKLEFAMVRRDLKKAYIDRGGVISRAKSWQRMDTDLRTLYIISTTARNVIDKYQSYELMTEIRKVGNEFKLLDNTLRSLGLRLDERGAAVNQKLGDVGVGFIYEHLMSHEFEVARVSIDNKNLVLYESKKTMKFGLYYNDKAEWVRQDGIVFEPNYVQMGTDLYDDNEGKKYIVETYTTGGEPDNTSLYCVFPIKENDNASGHFVTAAKFEMLKTKIRPKDENDDEDDDSIKISDFNPETDVDIKEIY